MLAQVLNAIKSRCRSWWTVGHGVGVSPGFWGLVVASICLAVVCHVGLALSFIARIFALELAGSDEFMNIRPWESFLTWPPLLLAVLLWIAFIGFRRSHDNRAFRDQFLAQNGNTPLMRALSSESAPRSLDDFVVPLVTCAMALSMAAAAIVSPGGGIEFMPTVALAVLVVFVGIIGLALYLGVWLSNIHKPIPEKFLPGFARKLVNRFSLRRQFESLPPLERSAMVSQAVKMGADPDSAAVMRGALADYRSRQEKASAEAQILVSATPPATSDVPSRRL